MRNAIAVCLAVLAVMGCGSQTPAVDGAQVLSRGGAAMATLRTVTATLKVTKGSLSLQGYALLSAKTSVRLPSDSDTIYTVKQQDIAFALEVVITGGHVYVHLPFSLLTEVTGAQAAAFPNLARLFDPSTGLPAVIPAGSAPKYVSTDQLNGVSADKITATYSPQQIAGMLAQLSSSGDVRAEIWVDTADHLIRKALLTGAFGDGGKDASIEVDITSFNGAVTITSPSP